MSAMAPDAGDAARLPSYSEQTPEVAERFRRLKERPVILEVRDLVKDFAGRDGGTTRALDRVSFRAHRREIMCVIGPSGCGKSTVARILAGLEDATSGEVLLDGKQVSGPGPDRGMVFQGYTLFPWLTVTRNVMFGLELCTDLVPSGNSAEEDARSWIKLVGLEKFAGAYPHQLSGGMKQRVAIARALAARPRILLMDEPFGALDAQTRAQMQSYLLQIWRQVDVTIIFITHDLDEAVYLADRILVLDAHPGRVRELMEVAVPRPRTPEQSLSPTFMAARRHLQELIHPASAQAQDRIPMIRMTMVGDDVE
ncbi:MAG TPA: ABC transporter ATP-binding protein [Polyangia bacterium]|jgi:NitT/TauT family transport system ATP-binding protein|nr:ABC transporter ATP-binding protein [Polyangia bacterium]